MEPTGSIMEPEKRLMEAFRTDCQTLITRFELTYNTHFQYFCEIWKEMQFGLVFAFHSSESTLTVFCEEALCITKQFLVNASSLKERIGALYLTYGVYYKIPVKNLKIRMTMTDWSCLLELHNQVKKEEFLDANYILCKLIVDRAFIHSISDRQYGIERHFYQKQEQPKLDVNLMPEIKELASPEKLLSIISQYSEAYEEKKRALYDAQGDSGLQLYDSSLADSIANSIRKIQSESRIFVKSEVNTGYGRSAASSISGSSDKDQKRMRFRKNQVLSKIGRGFEKGLQSEDELEQSD
ncbi:PREDICTED: snRNA-activating protein complex subunit 1-like [Vollenhovia emeryi]|uniref:snRNA-activating protein complex subunit 1-like n=1 Tax=Vollenhovia emeryi TaxID=411798 RepID=UPI0005F3EA18|nr:PREDICTED: snRNA-activating protein complex subunit 1-like [Vollenhovia emeryi]